MGYDCCLRYCKSTIFQANHNSPSSWNSWAVVVCDTAKVRFFKQITTTNATWLVEIGLFAILQKYDFSSKSQPIRIWRNSISGCLRYCKSTIFQANHNMWLYGLLRPAVVCDTAKVRFFKQITTDKVLAITNQMLFAILQKYDFSSKSQHDAYYRVYSYSCLRYCKSTIFQANHNPDYEVQLHLYVVCDTAKVRFFKQITTMWPSRTE